MISKIAKVLVHTKSYSFIDHIRTGWNNFSFIFFFSSVATILGGIFGAIGFVSIVITLIFFYYLGKLHNEITKLQEENKRLSR